MPSPEHEALVAALTAPGAVVTPATLPSREEFAQLRILEKAESVATPAGCTVEALQLGGVECLKLSEAGASSKRLILYFHGGGYLWLTPGSVLGAMAGLARSCEASCIAPHYRRAPEHPFPAPVDDAIAVYKALLAAGGKPGEIIFAGDSAGGGLVIAALLAAHERGLPRPVAGLAFSPWTDLAVTGPSADGADDPLVDGARLRMMAMAYLQGADPKTPLASPLYASAEALRALPPLLIQVGTREALLDDSRRFAAKAKEAGVRVKLEEHDGIVHMWMVLAPQLPESIRAYEIAGAFLAETARP